MPNRQQAITCTNDVAIHFAWWVPRLHTLRPRQNGRFLQDNIFKGIFFNENIWISLKISLKYVPKGAINNIPALVQIMAWHWPGDKLSSEPIKLNLLMHIRVIQPQWVNILVSPPDGFRAFSLIMHSAATKYNHYQQPKSFLSKLLTSQESIFLRFTHLKYEKHGILITWDKIRQDNIHWTWDTIKHIIILGENIR